MNKFITFGNHHVGALVVLASVTTALIVWGRNGSGEVKDRIARTLAVVLIVQEAAMHFDAILTDIWTIQTKLPVHLCSLSVYLTAIALWTRRDMIFQTAYFWSAGAVHGLATPNLEVTFPAFRFFQFFSGHGFIVMGILYLIFVYHMRPTWGGLHRVIGISLALTAFAGIVNWLIGANYMFLCEKPVGENILHLMPAWPWYVGILIGVAALHFYLLYLPFALVNSRMLKKRSLQKG